MTKQWLGLGLVGMTLMVLAPGAVAADKLFDPGRDAAADLRAAEAQAQAQHKNILMDVGGNWCPWCLLLDRTLVENGQLHQELEQHYVVLRVNFSRENENQAFLSGFPKPKGFPAWYVLSPEGKLLKAEDTSELEQTHKLGAGYNQATLESFLKGNAPGRE